MYQLIDESGEFLSIDEITKILDEAKVTTAGFDYNVVTVLGCQSSGKSTLLNAGFGTSFQVMNAKLGRNQTTKGLWIGKASKGPLTLVIDVEGTDSRERGEDRLTFEHRAALFSLALADMVIINLWYHDIGRYTASNLGLLKTVLAVNLELFQQEESCRKSTLLFVIRDYSENLTPMESLQRMMLADLQSIWNEIEKPDTCKKLDEYFFFQFIGVPSYIENPKLFLRETDNMEKRWRTSLRPKKYSRQIPGDGFCHYAKTVWETILCQSQLNIPGQKEMLATFRCEELKSSAFVFVQEKIMQTTLTIKSGKLNIKELTKILSEILQLALGQYNPNASRYQSNIYLKKKKELVDNLLSECQKICDIGLELSRVKSLEQATKTMQTLFQREENNLIGGEPKEVAWSSFSKTISKWLEACTDGFFSLAEACYVVIPDEGKTALNVSTHVKILDDTLQAMIQRKREIETSEFKSFLMNKIDEELEAIDVLFLRDDLNTSSFWKLSTDILLKAEEGVRNQFFSVWKGLSGIEAEDTCNEWRSFCVILSFQQHRNRLERVAEWLSNHIVARFQKYFSSDENGAPRVWGELKTEKIHKIFLNAKANALNILDIFSTAPDLSVTDEIGTELLPSKIKTQIMLPVLTDNKKNMVYQRSMKQMQKSCSEAQLLQAAARNPMNIPWWMYVLLFALGWNEMVLLFSSPVFLLSAVVGLLVLGVTFYTGNSKVAVNFVKQFSRSIAAVALPLLTQLADVTGTSGD